MADRAARLLITVGGIGTIVAVSTLCVFLVWEVLPLFRAPRVEARGIVDAPRTGEAPAAIGLDEYLRLGWTVSAAGDVRAFGLHDGGEIAQRALFQEPPSTFQVFGVDESLVAGFADGSVVTGTLGASSLGAGEPSPEPAALDPQEFSPTLSEPYPSGGTGPVLLADHVEGTNGPMLATLGEDHVLRISRGRRKTNLLTGEETLTFARGELALDLAASGAAPSWLLFTGQGDNVFLIWPDGAVWRCDAHELGEMRVAEKTNLFQEEGEARVTAVTMLLGRGSFAVGDSLGRIGVWFRTKPESAGTPDGIELARAHVLSCGDAPVTALAPSARTRSLAAGDAQGRLALFHVTSARTLARLEAPAGHGPVTSLALAPKEDALLVAGGEGLALLAVDVPHPETDLAAIFRPVWYESYAEPEHVWQSSSGTDDFEPKYGVMPLVFGTIKATFYSLLFGVPIALLAAVYTSEFLHARTKARIKPLIEMMASLPSVVLGFLSALVLAPLIEDVVPHVLLALVMVPFGACLGGALWRALPIEFSLRLERYRLGLVSAALALALAAAATLGGPLESWLFSGDMRKWLTGTVGSGTGGWALLLLPACALVVAWLVVTHVNPSLVRATREAPRARFALLDVAKFLVASAAAVLLALAIGALADRAGLDPRGGVLGTYVQRNALVVGFAMGFAIIPIVYTIAEDALAAVPDHLRAASLGAGATPWQTTVRVVVPTAMSGIFSAIMIGFGRAVGETMIVLMAAGNTPIMDWNVFNGFRTLSANIAVELSEAPIGSTHYRMLFLAALVLFAMTFLLNTAAEVVRLRYRKRRVQL